LYIHICYNTKQWVDIRIGDDHYVDLNSVGGGYVLLFYFLMYVVFMAYRSRTGFFLLGSVNWGGLCMVLLHHPDGK
jgi:hypothetical protein